MRDARQRAGLSKRALSVQLGEPHNLMQRIESLERDVSVAEFIKIAETLDEDPVDLLKDVLRRR